MKTPKISTKKQSENLWIVYEGKKFIGFIQKASGRFHFVYPDSVTGSGCFSDSDMENLIKTIKSE